jgi:hypothetical protein
LEEASEAPTQDFTILHIPFTEFEIRLFDRDAVRRHLWIEHPLAMRDPLRLNFPSVGRGDAITGRIYARAKWPTDRRSRRACVRVSSVSAELVLDASGKNLAASIAGLIYRFNVPR